MDDEQMPWPFSVLAGVVIVAVEVWWARYCWRHWHGTGVVIWLFSATISGTVSYWLFMLLALPLWLMVLGSRRARGR